jgi:hypothetical protein
VNGVSEDDVATVLRDALRREADAIEPSPDGLRRIRQAVPAPGQRDVAPRRALLVAAATGLVAAGGTAWGLARGGTEEPRPGQGEPTSGEPEPPSGEPEPPLPGGPWRTVVVYVVTMRSGRPRLVPERRRVNLDEQVGMRYLTMTPLGADHGTYWYWPLVYVIGGTPQEPIIIQVRSGGFRSRQVNSVEAATVAIQQLVWTVTENIYGQDPRRDGPVTILVDGKRGYRAWDLITLDRPFRRDPRYLA